MLPDVQQRFCYGAISQLLCLSYVAVSYLLEESRFGNQEFDDP